MERDVCEDKKVHEDGCILRKMIPTNKSPAYLLNWQTKLNLATPRANHLRVLFFLDSVTADTL